ncbi:MAG: protein-disulfide reductase DsbD domain-containing protein [Ginsengibacter sp.]
MKKIFFTLLTLFFLSTSFAQILNPVRFDYSVVKKGNNLYEVHIKTVLQPKWHIYSIKNPEGGADPTKIKVNEGNSVGGVKEKGKLKTQFEKEFKVNQKFYEDAVDFVQLVKLNSGDKITGNISYMVCNDKQCLPPKEVEFKIKL